MFFLNKPSVLQKTVPLFFVKQKNLIKIKRSCFFSTLDQKKAFRGILCCFGKLRYSSFTPPLFPLFTPIPLLTLFTPPFRGGAKGVRNRGLEEQPKVVPLRMRGVLSCCIPIPLLTLFTPPFRGGAKGVRKKGDKLQQPKATKQLGCSVTKFCFFPPLFPRRTTFGCSCYATSRGMGKSKGKTKRGNEKKELCYKEHNRKEINFVLATQSDKQNLKKSKKQFYCQTSQKYFWNQTFDKSRLKNFVLWFFLKYGEHKTVQLVEELKTIGFQYATKAGISLGIEDLKIPEKKSLLILEAENLSMSTIKQFKRGEITEVERFQRLIDTWHRTSERLKVEVIENFEETDVLNPVYMMAFSGARGNISQVRQLVGMRGLMSNPQGQIIDFPIRSNFREGLTLTEYIISSYGARKGIVDTALRTANAGYLTRRLVDVAQHVIISSTDCGTTRGIFLTDMKEGNKTIYSLQNRLIGRVLARDLYQNGVLARDLQNQIKIASKNIEISSELATVIALNYKKVFVRSPLTCQTNKLVCQLCYGWSLAQGNLVSIGEAVGVVAAQSIGEPGTQLTMRTFHTGGVFSGNVSDQIKAPFDGIVVYKNPIAGKLIRTPEGKIAFLTKTEGSFSVYHWEAIFFSGEQSSHKVGTSSQSQVSSTVNITTSKMDDQTSFPSVNIDEASLPQKNFKIPFYTLLFLRNREKVFNKQVIAQISSINRQKTATDQAELTIKAEISGLFYSKNLEIEENKVGPVLKDDLDDSEGPHPILDTINRAWNWGYAWILSGKIYQLPLPSSFFPIFGDFVNKKTYMNSIKWNIPGTFGSPFKLNMPLNLNIFNQSSIKKLRTGLPLHAKQHFDDMLTKKDLKLLKMNLISFESTKIIYQNIGYFLKLSEPSSSFSYLGRRRKKYQEQSSDFYNSKLTLTNSPSSPLFSIPPKGGKHSLFLSNNQRLFFKGWNRKKEKEIGVEKRKILLQNVSDISSILSLNDTLFLFSSIFSKKRFFSDVTESLKTQNSQKITESSMDGFVCTPSISFASQGKGLAGKSSDTKNLINPSNWKPSFNLFLNWFPKRFLTKTGGLIFMEPLSFFQSTEFSKIKNWKIVSKKINSFTFPLKDSIISCKARTTKSKTITESSKRLATNVETKDPATSLNFKINVRKKVSNLFERKKLGFLKSVGEKITILSFPTFLKQESLAMPTTVATSILTSSYPNLSSTSTTLICEQYSPNLLGNSLISNPVLPLPQLTPVPWRTSLHPLAPPLKGGVKRGNVVSQKMDGVASIRLSGEKRNRVNNLTLKGIRLFHVPQRGKGVPHTQRKLPVGFPWKNSLKFNWGVKTNLTKDDFFHWRTSLPLKGLHSKRLLSKSKKMQSFKQSKDLDIKTSLTFQTKSLKQGLIPKFLDGSPFPYRIGIGTKTVFSEKEFQKKLMALERIFWISQPFFQIGEKMKKPVFLNLKKQALNRYSSFKNISNFKQLKQDREFFLNDKSSLFLKPNLWQTLLQINRQGKIKLYNLGREKEGYLQITSTFPIYLDNIGKLCFNLLNQQSQLSLQKPYPFREVLVSSLKKKENVIPLSFKVNEIRDIQENNVTEFHTESLTPLAPPVLSPYSIPLLTPVPLPPKGGKRNNRRLFFLKRDEVRNRGNKRDGKKQGEEARLRYNYNFCLIPLFYKKNIKLQTLYYIFNPKSRLNSFYSSSLLKLKKYSNSKKLLAKLVLQFFSFKSNKIENQNLKNYGFYYLKNLDLARSVNGEFRSSSKSYTGLPKRFNIVLLPYHKVVLTTKEFGYSFNPLKGVKEFHNVSSQGKKVEIDFALLKKLKNRKKTIQNWLLWSNSITSSPKSFHLLPLLSYTEDCLDSNKRGNKLSNFSKTLLNLKTFSKITSSPYLLNKKTLLNQNLTNLLLHKTNQTEESQNSSCKINMEVPNLFNFYFYSLFNKNSINSSLWFTRKTKLTKSCFLIPKQDFIKNNKFNEICSPYLKKEFSIYPKKLSHKFQLKKRLDLFFLSQNYYKLNFFYEKGLYYYTLTENLNLSNQKIMNLNQQKFSFTKSRSFSKDDNSSFFDSACVNNFIQINDQVFERFHNLKNWFKKANILKRTYIKNNFKTRQFRKSKFSAFLSSSIEVPLTSSYQSYPLYTFPVTKKDKKINKASSKKVEKDLFGKLSQQNLNILLKQGWFYYTKNLSNFFLSNKKLIQSGKKIASSFVFDKHSVYIEIIPLNTKFFKEEIKSEFCFDSFCSPFSSIYSRVCLPCTCGNKALPLCSQVASKKEKHSNVVDKSKQSHIIKLEKWKKESRSDEIKVRLQNPINNFQFFKTIKNKNCRFNLELKTSKKHEVFQNSLFNGVPHCFDLLKTKSSNARKLFKNKKKFEFILLIRKANEFKFFNELQVKKEIYQIATQKNGGPVLYNLNTTKSTFSTYISKVLARFENNIFQGNKRYGIRNRGNKNSLNSQILYSFSPSYPSCPNSSITPLAYPPPFRGGVAKQPFSCKGWEVRRVREYGLNSFFRIKSITMQQKFLNKKYNSISLSSYYKTGLLNKQKITSQPISKYQSSHLKLISNILFYSFLSSLKKETKQRVSSNSFKFGEQNSTEKNSVNLFKKLDLLSEQNLIEWLAMQPSLKTELNTNKLSSWGLPAFPITSLKSINLFPFILSYKAPYALDFPFKTPMCFFSEQYQPTFLFNIPWKSKLNQQSEKNQRGFLPYYKAINHKYKVNNQILKQSQNMLLNENLLLQPKRSQSYYLKKILSNYLLKISRVTLSSKNTKIKNFIQNRVPHSIITALELSKTLTNLSCFFFSPIVEYSLVKDFAKSIIPWSTSLPKSDLKNLVIGNSTNSTEKYPLSNRNLYWNNINGVPHNKKFLYGMNSPILGSLNQNIYLNNKKIQNKETVLYKTEFISFINNTVNSQLPFIKTYSYSSFEGELIYRKKNFKKDSYISYPSLSEKIYSDLLLLKQTKPNSPLKKSLQKIIQQNFTNYFLANKIVDHVDNSCMVLTRNDQISYSFPVKDASFVRGNAVPHAVPCYPLKGVEVLLCLPHPSLMEQGGNVVSQGIKLKSGKHQNYKENYLSLEKLKKRNQYVINNIVINVLNLLVDSIESTKTNEPFNENVYKTLNQEKLNNSTLNLSQVVELNKIPAGLSQQKSKLLIGEFLVYGDKIAPNLAISKGGQIIHINNKKITLRQGQPIFISPQAILHKYDGDFVDEQSSVITLAYQQLKTGDIVQGIPKIEQFFEARTTKRGRLFRDSLENLLKAIFNRYNSKLSREQAVRQSFYKIQQIIIDGVQRVYRSQGVTIADKHLEVIVKQMTSKVRITFGGSTGYLPGEICDLYDIELLNKELRPKIMYEPIVLGITKASLEVKSFLSAASFQQTTRVLSKAALSRKNDYLNGLKENVILGNLIPAGTGYLVYLDQSLLDLSRIERLKSEYSL